VGDGRPVLSAVRGDRGSVAEVLSVVRGEGGPAGGRWAAAS